MYAACSYSCGLPGRTGSQSGAHKPISCPGCEERPLRPGHLQTCCIVKAFHFHIWKVGTEKRLHTCTTNTEKRLQHRLTAPVYQSTDGYWTYISVR